MKKNRIATRIKDKTGILKSKNRSEDLVVLREQYTLFVKNLKFLIATLTNKHTAMMNHSKARLEVAKAINSLTVDTPLFKCAGDIPATAVGTTDGGDSSEMVTPHQSNPQSYAAIHLQLHKKNKMYSDKYTEHILTYAKEWESILSTRIAKHLKQAEKLRVDLDHYSKKVEDMNKSMNKTMSKGKSINDSGVDKIKRNEQKLIQARQEYDRFVNDLCGFIEEIMDRGWKDLHPLLVKMAQFDSTLSNEEAILLKGSMSGVTEHLKGMGAKYPGLKPMGRLKELETWSLESLNKVNPASMRSESPLMIEQGGGGSARYLTSSASDASLGIHAGLGGGNDYPNDVPLGSGGGGGTDAYGRQMNREGSFASGGGADGGYGGSSNRSRNSTGESYDWASGGGAGLVPPGGANNNSDFMASPPNPRSSVNNNFMSPSSGGLPPLNPGNRAGSFGMPPRANSTQDMNASTAATSNMLSTMQSAAPPPTMGEIFGGEPTMGGVPPPPPNMPPPPPPQSMSMFDGGSQMSQLSLYDNNGSRSSYVSSPPGRSMSQGPSNTNPFGDNFGGGGTPNPAPYNNSPAPPQGHPYGGANTNPFG
eukprot:CAMPEP_0196137856 /NCGR_PEP_ID=MMETSP0910-20130528/5702_1 /TAXON_ID=49265 /ORGANISM="Thalassiosira rotula, Strain GSO102" /LENGTH=590 /DNA_ID=CAMNT_0041398373 /DNA_START=24 /DNA_END=1796 /DNA_ORIENTATION=+